MLPSSEFLKELEWLASRPLMFFTYFIFFLSFRNGEPPLWLLVDRDLETLVFVRRWFNYYSFHLQDHTYKETPFFIFSKRICNFDKEQAEAVRLAGILKKKLGIKSI